MCIHIKKEFYLGEVNVEGFLEKLDAVEKKVLLVKESILKNKHQSCELQILDCSVKEINESGNANLDIEKVKQIYFLNYNEKIIDAYTDLIKTIHPFISEDVNRSSTCDELLEKISLVQAKIKSFISHNGSPFVNGLPTEILTKILGYISLDKVTLVCKKWRNCSAGVWTRHWLEILEGADTPLEMKEGMRALQRLFPKDSGSALISKFFRFFNIYESGFQFNKNGSVNFIDYFSYNEIKKLSRIELISSMIECFNQRKDRDLIILLNCIIKAEFLVAEPNRPMLYERCLVSSNADEIRSWMKLESNHELLKVITSIDLHARRRDLPGVINIGRSLRTIPPEIIYLKNLNTIHANVKSYFSDFPGIYLIYLPSEICKLNNLEEVELCGNGLTELPSDIGNLKKMKRLDLSRNKLNSLPESFSQLYNLNTIKL